MKQRILKITLLLCISITVTNCEKDNIEQTIEPQIIIENQANNFSIKRIYKNKIQKNTKLNNKLKKLNNNIFNKRAGKSKHINKYNFVMNTEQATYIVYGSYHSYTFPIKQSRDKNIKNVMFSLNENNEYDAFLAEYSYSFNDLKSLNGIKLSNKVKMTPIDLDFNSLTQKITSFWVCSYEYETQTVDADEGILDGDNDTIEVLVMHCDVIWGATTDDSDYYNSSTSGSSSGGNSGGQTNSFSASGGFISSPTFSVYDEQDLTMYHILDNELGLNTAQYNFLYTNYGDAIQLFDFLSNENFSETAKQFSLIAINILMNGGEVNYEQMTYKCPLGNVPNDNGNCVTDPFNTNSLTNEQKTAFHEAVNALLETCMGNALINSVINVNINVGTVTTGALAQYNPNTNTITFRPDSVGDALPEELFHAYQQQLYGTLIDISNSNTGHLGGSNIEFEEKAYTMLSNWVENFRKMDKNEEEGGGLFVADATPIFEELTLLNEWVIDLVTNHTSSILTLSEGELQMWFEALESFRSHHFAVNGCGITDVYGCPIDLSIKPDALINLFKKSLENCN